MSRDRAAIKRFSAKQGYIVGDYSPLHNYDQAIDDLGLANAGVRAKGEALDRRHNEGDIIMQLVRTPGFNPYGHGKKPQGFSTAHGMPYSLEEHAIPIGICEEDFFPNNSPDDALKSVALRTTTSLRLNAQRKGHTLEVDHGTTLIARFLTLEEERDGLYMVNPEITSMSQWAPRSYLPIVEPLHAAHQSGQSLDTVALFDRSVEMLMHNQGAHRQLKTTEKMTEAGLRHGSEYNTQLWDEIDVDVITTFSESLFTNGCLVPELEPFVCADMEKSDRSIRSASSEQFRSAFAFQMLHTMSAVQTTEDCINAQQQIVQLTMIMNWHLMRDETTKRNISRLYSATDLYQQSVSALLALGQQHSEKRCRNILGLSLEHGGFKDNVDVWIQPSSHGVMHRPTPRT